MPEAASKPAAFWVGKSLGEMNLDEWESLCDGCAKCCLEKLEDPDTGDISFTEVGCELLDVEACQCTNYFRRARRVPDCQRLTITNIAIFKWMPSTCAYRLLSEGKDLPDWHPLISGDADSVHRAGVSVRGRAVAAGLAGDWEDHIVEWPE
ncbi:MAG: YcgN family cysteine cluster protein [Alphaproteobacteria bacterium]